jgi:hypothetical protein
MNMEDFYTANETIERDPVKRLNARVEQICNRILPDDLPADVRAAIEGSRLAALHTRAKDAIERGREYLLEEVILPDFANELRDALNFERTNGALKVTTGADEIKRCSGRGDWERFVWNGFETGTISRVLERGERIESVGFREIKTSKRTIVRRDEIFDRFRPISNSREHWLKQCTPESQILERERMAAREATESARPFHQQSGPAVAPR